MIRIDCVQGTTEWAMHRLGRPTASRFNEIITPKTMKLSASAAGYAHDLLAEQHLGEPLDGATSGFMQRGSVMEKQAIDYYEMIRDCDVERVGFVLRDDRRAGCSPDFFVGNDGMGEIKSPEPSNHIGYLLDDQGIGYRTQCQGGLYICEREWIDTVSFHPKMPGAVVRQYRDEAFIKALAAAIDQFLLMMDEMKLKLQKLGMFEGERIPDLRVA